MIRLIDTHCHLTEPPLVDDVQGVLERAVARGVTDIVVPAWNLASWSVVEDVARFEGVWPAYGLHPWASAQPLTASRLEAALDRPGVVAVGEIGLDSKIARADLDRQLRVLRLQLEIARDRDLPVMLHCRGAHELLLGALREVNRGGRPVRGVVHAFSRSPELARRFIDAGLSIAYAGTITRARARVRRTAAEIPLRHVLLETDAPSISLEGLPAAKVEPAHTRAVAEALAELRTQRLEDIAERTTRNALALFAVE